MQMTMLYRYEILAICSKEAQLAPPDRKLHFISVCKFDRGFHSSDCHIFYVCYSLECILNPFLLRLQLTFVGKMLQLAPATFSKVGAAGNYPLGGLLKNRIKFRFKD